MSLSVRPLTLDAIDTCAVEAYALFVAQDERPLQGFGGLLDWRMAGGLSRHLREGHLSGALAESFLTTPAGALPGQRIFAFGIGPLVQVTAERFRAAVQKALVVLQGAKAGSIAIGLPESPSAMLAGRILTDVLRPLSGVDVTLFGPEAELLRVLKESLRTK